jgi:Carboxypeptidase regulatory-like domain/TonB-dependent Receptor Plug Domain
MLGRLYMAKRPGDRLRRLLLLVSIVTLLCGGRALVAQVDQGTITGTATDTQGALVPGAKVTLTQLDTGLVLQGTTNNAGIYVFSPVKIGRYSVAMAAAGFESVSQTDLNLDVNQTLTVDFQLHPGNVSQSVTVEASAAELLQKEDASTGQVVSSTVINDTPLALRNYVFIAQLAAGVTEANGSRGQGKGDFNANGLRAEQNNFVLDGVDNNSNQVDFLNGASFVVKPPPDALAEFKVQTSDYDAEFGHSAGAVVNASIKSGTNEIHGDMWEYARNNDLGMARDFFNRTCTGSACTPGMVPPYHQNQFGATLGGPFLKNKLFWFGDLEVLRVINPSNGTYTVPTALMRTGDFSELLSSNPTLNGHVTTLYEPGSGGATPLGAPCGNNTPGTKQKFCAGEIDPVAQKILNLYPSPNTGATGLTSNNYVINTSVGDNTVSWDTRLDWNPTQKDQAFFRMSYYNERGT